MSLRLAVATEDFGTPLRRAILLAGQSQVSGIRLNARHEILSQNMSASALRQLSHYVQENRMEVAGLSCPTRHSLASPEYLDRRVELIRSAMALSRPLNSSSLLVSCGSIPDPAADTLPREPGYTDAEQPANPFSLSAQPSGDSKTITQADQFSALCQVVSDLAGYGNHVGCILALQLPGYDVSLTEQLLEAVTTGPLQIVFDPAVAVFTDTNVIDSYRHLYHHVGYIRARDGLRNSLYSGTETAVGDGVTPWDELMPTLIESDYSGWVCVERTGGDHRESDVLRGVSYLQSLLPPPADG